MGKNDETGAMLKVISDAMAGAIKDGVKRTFIATVGDYKTGKVWDLELSVERIGEFKDAKH